MGRLTWVKNTERGLRPSLDATKLPPAISGEGNGQKYYFNITIFFICENSVVPAVACIL